MNVSKVLKKETIKYGLCVAWTKDWGSPTKEQMTGMYIAGLDFCILHNYPSNDFIKEHFGQIAVDKGIYTDMKVDVLNPPAAILNGNCTGKIELTGFASKDIHVRHDSKIKVVIRDSAKAFIRVYDNAHVTVENQTGSRSYVYLKGGTATISGNVVVRNYKRVGDNWVLIKDEAL